MMIQCAPQHWPLSQRSTVVRDGSFPCAVPSASSSLTPPIICRSMKFNSFFKAYTRMGMTATRRRPVSSLQHTSCIFLRVSLFVIVFQVSDTEHRTWPRSDHDWLLLNVHRKRERVKRDRSGGKKGMEKGHWLISCLLQLSLGIDAVCLFKMG